MPLAVKYLAKPALRDASLVGAVPDSGPVAGFTLSYLIARLDARPLAEAYSPHLPPQVSVEPGGVAKPQKFNVYYWLNPDRSKGDLMLFTGDSQPTEPEAAYDVVDWLLGLAESLGVKAVYSVGAYLTRRHVDHPRLFAASTDAEILRQLLELGVQRMGEGTVSWVNGLLFGLARLRGMVGVYLCSETYGPSLDPDAIRASQAIVGFLGGRLGFKA